MTLTSDNIEVLSLYLELQSNLCTTATLGTLKKVAISISGRCAMIKLRRYYPFPPCSSMSIFCNSIKSLKAEFISLTFLLDIDIQFVVFASSSGSIILLERSSLWPGVNFINILRAAFEHADPKSAKRQSSCQSLLHFQDLGV